MTRFWVQIAIWSTLHELVQIFESSRASVFESPVYWVHNEHNLNIAQTSPNRCNTQLYVHKYTNTNIYTQLFIHIYTLTCMYTTYTYILTHIHYTHHASMHTLHTPPI